MSVNQLTRLPLRCWAEIDTSALCHNARVAGSLAGGGPECVMAVVKADAYGHGLPPVVEALRESIGAFAVATLPEALVVEQYARRNRDGGMVPIYILSPALPGEMGEIAARGFIPAVSTMEEIRAYAGHAAANRPVNLHLVVDTGMGRMGALPDTAEPMIELIRSLPSTGLDSLSTHFPSSDEDEVFTRSQEDQFRRLLAAWRLKYGDIRSHIANSAGILHYPRTQGETVRAGLMLYGVSPMAAYQSLLRPALTWKTRITLVRDLPAGWGVSYGRTFITERPAAVATLAAGYGDGYPRHVSGKGAFVEVQGRRCPVLGRVTMDQIMIDVSHLESRPVPGDVAVLLGTGIPVCELAALAGTIPWHIFTGITNRTVRIPVGPAAAP